MSHRSSAYGDKCTSCGAKVDHSSGKCRTCRIKPCDICLTSFDPRHRVSGTCPSCERKVASMKERGIDGAADKLRAHYRNIDQACGTRAVSD